MTAPAERDVSALSGLLTELSLAVPLHGPSQGAFLPTGVSNFRELSRVPRLILSRGGGAAVFAARPPVAFPAFLELPESCVPSLPSAAFPR